jgi:hypothetical protein
VNFQTFDAMFHATSNPSKPRVARRERRTKTKTKESDSFSFPPHGQPRQRAPNSVNRWNSNGIDLWK